MDAEEYVAQATDHIAWGAFPDRNENRLKSDVREVVEFGDAGANYAPAVEAYVNGKIEQDVLKTSATEMARTAVSGSRAMVDLQGMAQHYRDQGIAAGQGNVSYDVSGDDERRLGARGQEIVTTIANVSDHYENGVDAARYREDFVEEILGETPMQAARRHLSDAGEADMLDRAERIAAGDVNVF